MQKGPFRLKMDNKHRVLQKYALNGEQTKAFNSLLNSKRFFCIQGSAGTGKTFLLNAIREAYEMKGHSVRGLSLTGEVVRGLKSSGFSNAETLHRLLFAFHHGSKKYQNKEIWIIDEASMLDNKVLQEILGLAWKQNNQIILVGDAQQLPSVARGGMFKVFCDRYQGAILSDIMRQEKKWGKDTSVKLSQGKISEAINLLVEKKAIHWSNTKEEGIILKAR